MKNLGDSLVLLRNLELLELNLIDNGIGENLKYLKNSMSNL